MEPETFAGIVKQKINALERKRAQTLHELSAQIELLEVAYSQASKVGASQTALRLELAIQKLDAVRADALKRFNEAICELTEQGSASRGTFTLAARPSLTV